MTSAIRASRDIILRTTRWEEALHFYSEVLGFPVVHRGESLVGFETGAFCLYVENGKAHGPVLDFLTVDVPNAKDRLVAAGCVVVEEDSSAPRCYLQDPFGLVFNVGTVSSGK